MKKSRDERLMVETEIERSLAMERKKTEVHITLKYGLLENEETYQLKFVRTFTDIPQEIGNIDILHWIPIKHKECCPLEVLEVKFDLRPLTLPEENPINAQMKKDKNIRSRTWGILQERLVEGAHYLSPGVKGGNLLTPFVWSRLHTDINCMAGDESVEGHLTHLTYIGKGIFKAVWLFRKDDLGIPYEKPNLTPEEEVFPDLEGDPGEIEVIIYIRILIDFMLDERIYLQWWIDRRCPLSSPVQANVDEYVSPTLDTNWYYKRNKT